MQNEDSNLDAFLEKFNDINDSLADNNFVEIVKIIRKNENIFKTVLFFFETLEEIPFFNTNDTILKDIIII